MGLLATDTVSDRTGSPAAGAKKKKRLSSISTKEGSARRLVEYFVVVSSIPRPDTENESTRSIVSLPSPPTSPPLSPGRKTASGGTTAASGTGGGGSHVKDDPSAVTASVQSGLTNDSHEDEFVDDFDFQPVITARYPLEDHIGNPLHESVTCFCHPSGGIRLRFEFSMPKIHYFVATGGNGKQMYGTCLTLWEPYMITSKKTKKKAPQAAPDGDSEGKTKEVFLPKCVVILSIHPYLVAFREYLTQLNRLTKMGDMPLPIERYITNFCAEIPAPPPGSFEVQTTILDSVIKLWSPPFNQPIAWVSLPFSHLFECLDLDNIFVVWHALALERQVLLTSTQLSLLTTCSEILLSLLFPMRWSHAYIPVLPHFLIPILSAPMPYLCGITKANLVHALFDLSKECVVVDLDKNLVTMGPNTAPLPPLPQYHMTALRSKLDENVGMVFREARSLTKNDDFSDRGMHLQPHVKMMADAMWESRLCLFDEAFHLAFTPEESRKNLLNGNDNSGIETSAKDLNNPTVPIRIMTAAEKQNLRKQSPWDAVQEAFLDTYVFLLRNYRKFLVFPSKENEGFYGGAGFRSKEFIMSQRYDMQEFLEQLIGTQMFDDFVTKRLYGSGEADVTFFDMAVDRFLKNAGLLSNVDVGGAIRKASGVTQKSGSSGPGLSNRDGTGKSGIRNLLSRKQNSNTAKASSSGHTSSAASKGLGPLLQSARVHRKLKTIVPPEPSSENLPSGGQLGNAVVVSSDDAVPDDDISISSSSTSGTHSTKGTRSTSRSATTGVSSITGTQKSPRREKTVYGSSSFSRQEDLEREKTYCYTYPIFPSELNGDLFGAPRPMPSAVLAEFDRQRENAARFRRRAQSEDEVDQKSRKHRKNRSIEKLAPPEKPPSPEIATFTVFFMSFTAVVGKELIDISSNPLLKASDRTILSTYNHSTVEDSSVESDDDESQGPLVEAGGEQGTSSEMDATGEGASADSTQGEEDFEDAVSEVQESQVNGERDGTEDVLEGENSPKEKDSSSERSVDSAEESGAENTKAEDRGRGVDPPAADEGEQREDDSDQDSLPAEEVSTENVADSDRAVDGVGGDKDALSKDDTAGEVSAEDGSGVAEEGKSTSEGKDDVEASGELSAEKGDAVSDGDNENVPTDQAQDGVVGDEAEEGSETSMTSPKKNGDNNLPSSTPKQDNRTTAGEEIKPRNRFQDELSTLQIEEAKATAKAQLGLAFEMLTMMKKRGLKADPAAYQSLIDACGRCGDSERATQLLAKMHEDGIVADGVVYSCLVSAFSSENAWKKGNGKQDEDLPEWANSASVEMDWNKLQKRSYLDRAKKHIRGFAAGNQVDGNNPPSTPPTNDTSEPPAGSRRPGMTGFKKTSARVLQNVMSRKTNGGHKRVSSRGGGVDHHAQTSVENVRNFFVSEPVMRQILLGENLLEIVYPDISIDTDNELCPRCSFCLSDDDVVDGWSPRDSQDYTTKCPNCTQKFVPRFCVQSTSPTFVGSRGPSSPLLCERLSPWVLQKELRSVMGDRKGIENLLSPEWREQETKNAVLWWNLVLSFMRYRFPFSFLLQGSFEQNLIAPTPGDDTS